MKDIMHSGWETAKKNKDSDGAKRIAIAVALEGWNVAKFATEDEFVAEFSGSPDADIALGLGEWIRDGFGECSYGELKAAASARYREFADAH